MQVGFRLSFSSSLLRLRWPSSVSSSWAGARRLAGPRVPGRTFEHRRQRRQRLRGGRAQGCDRFTR